MKPLLAALLTLSVAANAQIRADNPESDPKPPAQAENPPSAEPPQEAAEAPGPSAADEPGVAEPDVAKDDAPPQLSVLAQTAEAQATITGWKFSASFANDIGLGTFTNPEQATASYAGGGLSFGPSFSFRALGKKLAASARMSVGWEYTLPDASTGRRFDWSDLRLGLSAPAVFRETAVTGIALSPRVGFMVPLTLESWKASTITVLSAGLDLSRTFDRVDLLYRLSASRGIHGREFVATPAASVPFQSNTVKCRKDDVFCDYGGQNTAWTASNMISATWRTTDSLAFDASFVLSHSWRYPLPQDEFTPKALDSNGNPVARGGFVRNDMVQVSLGVSYAFTEHLEAGFSVGYGPGGGALPLVQNNTPEGGWRVRGPFDYPVSNNTSFSLGLSALY